MTDVSFRRRALALVAAAAMSGALAGCSIISKVNHVVNTISQNKATIDQFAGKLRRGKAVPFAATYVTTGRSPATVVYAVSPPHDVAFKEVPGHNPNGNPSVDLIINPSGGYGCSSTSGQGSGPWQCTKFASAKQAAQNQVFNFYTPSHWINFLLAFSLAAGFAGDKVSTSTMSVNGFSLDCVDLRAPGVPGVSTICSTSAGILGYVKVANNSHIFEIKSYTGSPSASYFKLPAGAKVVSQGG